jgi:hypothetical protein
MEMGPEVLPWLSLGLGVQQMGQSQRYADLASQGLNPAQQAQMRQAGTSNIGANLAQRGLLDSSLYGGGLGQLEQYIAQSQNPQAGQLWNMAQGYGQGGAQTLGNLAQMYQLKQMFGNQFPGMGGFTGNPYASWQPSQYGTMSPPWFGYR